jgi:hypothetical protein
MNGIARIAKDGYPFDSIESPMPLSRQKSWVSTYGNSGDFGNSGNYFVGSINNASLKRLK